MYQFNPHLSENHGEINWVASLHPESPNYTDVYYEHRLMGQVTYSDGSLHSFKLDVEIDRMAETQTMVSSLSIFQCKSYQVVLAPIRKLMKRNIPIGLGPISLVVILYRWRRFLREAIGLSK